jgi:hypothetical protein
MSNPRNTPARAIVTQWIRDWPGDAPQALQPRRIDLCDARDVEWLRTVLGDLVFDDVCFEGESAHALAALERLFNAEFGAARVDAVQAASSPLYRPGYRVFALGRFCRCFVNARPRPELFAAARLDGYAREFSLP